MKTEHSMGWGLRVGGPRPYLAWGVFEFSKASASAQCSEKYHTATRVVLLTLREYHKLVKGQRR